MDSSDIIKLGDQTQWKKWKKKNFHEVLYIPEYSFHSDTYQQTNKEGAWHDSLTACDS